MSKRVLVLLSCFLFLWACGPKHRVKVERDISAPPSVRPRETMKGEPLRERRREKIEAETEKRETRFVQYGIASWYGPDFHGKPTSSGEIYDMYELSCAHNSLPLGAVVIVTNLENGKSLELRVNDRGPFAKGRIIDVSYAAARILGIWEKGTAPVRVEGVGSVVEEVIRYTLQVGSFTDELRAQALVEQLKPYFKDVHVTTVETSTQRYHRVRVGRFEAVEPAVALAHELSQMGYQVLITTR